MRRSWTVISLIGLVIGCRAPEPQPTPTPLPPTPRTVAATKPSTRPGVDLPKTLAMQQPKITARRVGPAPKDPPPPLQLATKFEIYDITLPAGAVSRSEPFWKIVDEEQIDPGTYDVLRRNGVRIGVAPVTDWPALRDQIADLPSTTQMMSVTGREATNVELPMKKDVVDQNIFVYMPDGTLVGRTFEKCENILAFSFQQTPRKPGELRVALSPLVRGTRKHLVYTAMGNEGEFSYVRTERALDVNLRAEIPLDHLLIVAPSDEARTASSVGHAFLMTEGPAEKQEHVLVMVPRMFRIENEPTAKK
jgi:hypothetical protein